MVARQRPWGYPRAKRGAEQDWNTVRRTIELKNLSAQCGYQEPVKKSESESFRTLSL